MAFNWFKKSKQSTEASPATEENKASTHNDDAHGKDTIDIDIDEPSILTEHEAAQTLPLSSPQTTEQTPAERTPDEQATNEVTVHASVDTTQVGVAMPKDEGSGYLQQLKQGLSKTRDGFADLFLGKKALDDSLIEELEMQLLTADVGIDVTETIIAKVTERIKRNELSDVEAVKSAMSAHMQTLLAPYAQPLNMSQRPFVILMTGINGAGKTTTIGKLAHLYRAQGKKVMLAAGDTFRAAAVEQLQTWGERNNVPVIAQATGADSASVAYDALQSAMARDIDVLIIDTAGRLHTQAHLMEELKKIKRVLQKLDENAPHETMLVIDAGNGQNALRQAQEFHQMMAIDGITITKLDGTAKGGILFAITNQLHLPIRFIGVGEKPSDLRPFNATDFVNALLYSE